MLQKLGKRRQIQIIHRHKKVDKGNNDIIIWFFYGYILFILSGGDSMPNFTRFLSNPQFTSFAEVAVSAEKIYAIDPAACVLNCRRSMEFAVKWMYSWGRTCGGG